MTLIVTLLVIAVAYIVLKGGTDPVTIGKYASNAGFSGTDLATAVAICYAESGGNADSIGDLDLGISVGLWQINLAAHPEYTQDELLDPQTNANAAYAIYQAAGYSFSPWTTFNTGAYLKYLDQDSTSSNDTVETGTDSGDE